MERETKKNLGFDVTSTVLMEIEAELTKRLEAAMPPEPSASDLDFGAALSSEPESD